jgi:hypothetical protein
MECASGVKHAAGVVIPPLELLLNMSWQVGCMQQNLSWPLAGVLENLGGASQAMECLRLMRAIRGLIVGICLSSDDQGQSEIRQGTPAVRSNLYPAFLKTRKPAHAICCVDCNEARNQNMTSSCAWKRRVRVVLGDLVWGQSLSDAC